jgi:uncharacterized membrane protein
MSAAIETKSQIEQIAPVLLKEALALGLVAPLAACFLNESLQTMVGLTILFSFMAMSWEYCVNRAYEYLLIRYALSKTKLIRTQHALAIEGGLAVMTVPILMRQLNMAFGDALLADLSLAAFYWVWTYAFYWAYDSIRPKLVGKKVPL